MCKDHTSIIVIAVIAFFALSGYKADKPCRSHDGFMFHCHHNDNNTDIYLRRLNAKFDKAIEVIEQMDTTPDEVKERRKFEEAAIVPKAITSCMLTQLRLFRAGKLHTGLWAIVLPSFLRNDDDMSFDHATDATVCFLTEAYHYTKEEADVLRNTLLERSSGIIEHWATSQVRSNMRALIELEISEFVIEKNGYKTPHNLWMLVTDLYSELEKDESREQAIMTAVSNGEINDIHALERLIRKIYLGS